MQHLYNIFVVYLMKALLSISFVVISILSQGQTKSPFHVDSTDDNIAIVKFVKANIGKKVGNGVCMSLVTEAYKKKFPDWTNERFYNWDTLMNHSVELNQAKAGDMITFDDSLKGIHHIGIVTFIKGDIIWYADQNTGVEEAPVRKVFDQGGITEVFVYSRVVYRMIDVRKRGNREIWLFHY